VLTRLGAVQLDTISVLARSHEVVCFSRVGPVGRPAIEAAIWGADANGRPRALEYWGHAASILPLEMWPSLAFRRRRFRANNRWRMRADPKDLQAVRDRLRRDGPMTAAEMGGAKRQGGDWWDWSPVKVAVELLLDWGEVVCVERRGWKRVYDLPERVLPDSLLGEEPDDSTCLTHLVATAGACLGVGTVGDLADYFRITRRDVAEGLPESGLVPVAVHGWTEPAWADPAALEKVGGRGRHRTTLLSPFDSMIWYRPRTERLFDYTHRIEAYTPAPQRIHGYYPMPVLAGGRLVGRVDPGRSGRSLVAKQVGISIPGEVPAVADALRQAAQWVGAESVEVGRVDPPQERKALLRCL
jgi:uncharacterized protein YcaQ